MNENSTTENEYLSIVRSLDAATSRANGRRDFSDVSEKTGLTSAWLSCFTKGEIRDAGYHRVKSVESWLLSKNMLIKSNVKPSDEAA